MYLLNIMFLNSHYQKSIKHTGQLNCQLYRCVSVPRVTHTNEKKKENFTGFFKLLASDIRAL